MTGETIISVTYGLNVQAESDPYLEVAERAVEGFSIAAVPGTFLVDSVPILKYVPEWLPGAGFQKKAREWKNDTLKMVQAPFSAAKRNLVRNFLIMSMPDMCILYCF